MSYKTIWEPNGVYQVFSEILTKEDRVNSNRDVEKSPLFDNIKYWIIDSLKISDYENIEIDAHHAAAHSLGASYVNRSVRLAFVTTNSKHKHNIEIFIKILKKHNSPWEIEIFNSVGFAKDWVLNI